MLNLSRGLALFFIPLSLSFGDDGSFIFVEGAKGLVIPQSTVITDSNFNPQNDIGDRSTGETILGYDGKPLSDHHVFALDTSYFIVKVKDGVDKSMPKLKSSHGYFSSVVRKRIDLENLRNGRTLREVKAKDVAARIEKYEKDIEKARSLYVKITKMEPEKEPRHEISDLLARLRWELDYYHTNRGKVNRQERLKTKDRIDLSKAPGESGKAYRINMIEALKNMADLRGKISSNYESQLDAGDLGKDWRPNQEPEEVFYVNRDKTWLFPIPDISRQKTKGRLLMAKRGGELSKAKPIFLPKGMKIIGIKSEWIDYTNESGETVSVEFRYVKAISDEIQFFTWSGKSMRIRVFRGWVLAEHLDAASK